MTRPWTCPFPETGSRVLSDILLIVRSWDKAQVYRWSVAVNLPIYHPPISFTIVLNFKKVFDSSPGLKIN